jgi:hypothetical protein
MLRPTGSPESMRPGAWGRCSRGLVWFGIEEAPVGSWPRAARVGEVRAPPAPGEPHTPFGLEGFGEYGVVLSTLGLGACPPLGTLCRSTLRRGVLVDVLGHSAQRLTNKKIVKEETYS